MILHVYFARRFALALLGITAVLTALVALVDIIDQTRKFSDFGVGFGQRIVLTLLNVPETINQILPLIMILGTVALFVSLARSSELVVTRAAGRSALRALVGPVVVSLIVGILATTTLGPIVAATSKRYAALAETYRSGGVSALSISEEGLWLRQGGDSGQTVIRATRSNADASVLYDVTFVAFKKPVVANRQCWVSSSFSGVRSSDIPRVDMATEVSSNEDTSTAPAKVDATDKVLSVVKGSEAGKANQSPYLHGEIVRARGQKAHRRIQAEACDATIVAF